MAQKDRRPDRGVLAAAAIALVSTAAYVTVIVVDLAGGKPIDPSVDGLLRAVSIGSICVWAVVAGVTRITLRIESGREERWSAGYAAGYVDGVARKAPAASDRPPLHSVN